MQAKAFGCFLVLCAIPAPGFALSGSLFHAGDRVFTIRGGLAIRSGASLSATVLGTQTGASLGTVLRGPEASGGHAWWNVDFDEGDDGWIADDFLTGVTTFPLPPLPAPSAPRPLRLRVNAASRHFLERSDGSPFFWMGDTGWVAMTFSPADLDLYFTDCASNGFNVSQVVPAWDPFHPKLPGEPGRGRSSRKSGSRLHLAPGGCRASAPPCRMRRSSG